MSLWNLKTLTKMEDIKWQGEEEMMFSSHESPKINAAQFVSHNKHSEILFLMAGGDTDEFRIFTKDFIPIISISGLHKSTFTCHSNKRGDVITLGGGDGVV